MVPKRVFFYVGVPVKKIIGFADIVKIEPVDLEAAVRIKKNAVINEDELSSYIAIDQTVSAIWISRPTIFSDPFTLSDLNRLHSFNPPQSFSYVTEGFESFLLREEL